MQETRAVQETPAYEPPPPPPAPRVEERQPEPRRVEEPRIDAKRMLDDSGLVMVETDRSKAVQIAPADEPQQPLGRPRRERARPAAQDDQLVQVETSRK
ncbi:MAG TPA: hypothetical protein VIV54_24355 [Burkholderiales bacterium]